MDIKELLETLVEYERLDAPTCKKERIAWKMYVADKIVSYIGAYDLCLTYNYPSESLKDRRKPNVYGMVANMLDKK